MKTILNLSIGLMLIAGAAGAFDFIKMFRSGEIDHIYKRDENQGNPEAVNTPSPAEMAGEASLIRLVSTFMEKPAPIEEFSRADPGPPPAFNSAAAMDTVMIEQPAQQQEVVPAVHKVSHNTQMAQVKPKLNYKMFSRAMVVEAIEEPEVPLIDSVMPAIVDSSTTQIIPGEKN